jgi:hypothetical protein
MQLKDLFEIEENPIIIQNICFVLKVYKMVQAPANLSTIIQIIIYL